jgi:hypothetical protein
VPFNDRCTLCGRASGYFSVHPRCLDCDEPICEQCAFPGTLEEDEGRRRCVCVECWRDGEEDDAYPDPVNDVDFS